MSRHRELRNLSGLCLMIVGTAGCPDGLPDSETLSAVLDLETAIGGSEQRVVFMRQDYPELPPLNWWSILTDPAGLAAELESLGESFLPTTRVVVFDPQSLEATLLTDADIAAEPYFFGQTDGRWLVWQSDEGDGVQVLDLETGGKSVALQGLDTLWINRLENGWLLAEVYGGADSIIIAHHLSSGDETILLVKSAGWGASLSGDQMAVQYFPNALDGEFPGIIELDWTDIDELFLSNVDVIDLTTGERRTVLTGLQDNAYALIGGDVIWIERQSDDGSTSLEAYDLQTGQTLSMPLPPLPDPDGIRQLTEAGSIGALVYTSYSSEDDSQWRDIWELWTPDGNVQTILDYTQGGDPLSLVTPVYPGTRFAGSLIVYQDPQTRDWVIYDPATGDRRTVSPF